MTFKANPAGKLKRARGPDHDAEQRQAGKRKRTRGKDPEPFVAVPSIRRRRGRPNDYDPRLLWTVQTLALAGATDVEIADAVGVSVSTLLSWCAKEPKFSEALSSAKDGYDERAELTLARVAMGYTVKAEKIFVSDGVVTRVEYDEYVKPNVRALETWLRFRRPAKWNPTVEVNLNGKVDVELHNAPTHRETAMAVIALLREAASGKTPGEDLTPLIDHKDTDDDAAPVEAPDRTPEPATALHRGDHSTALRRPPKAGPGNRG